MGKWLLLVALGFGAWSWHNGTLPWMSGPGAFDENGEALVYLFTFSNCGRPCDSSRANLKKRRVHFTEMQVDFKAPELEATKTWKKYRDNNQFPLIVVGSQKLVGGDSAGIAGVLAQNFGELYLTGSERRYFRNHFYPDGSAKIVMYGADWCGYCARLRESLEDSGLDYVEIDVDKSSNKKHIAETMGVYGYPTTYVGYTRVRGVDLKAVKDAMKNNS